MSDSIVRHRLFWSFFILSTEKWLGTMAASGFYLRDLNYRGRFLFERGEPGKSRYSFAYAKFENIQSRKAKHSERGWEEVSHHERWRVYRSGNDSAILPNRRGLYLRNNSLLCLYALISSITLLVVFSVVLGLFAYLSNTGSSSEAFFQGAIGIIGAFAILLLANFVLFLRMSVANNHILEQPVAAQTPEKAYRQYLRHKTFEDWLEKLLIRDGDIVRRVRLLWIFSPHGLEKWLARMESKGFNVYKVHKTGMLFYFIKSTPRSIRYCVVNSEGEDISQYLETGWRVVYSSGSSFTRSGRMVLLSIAYQNNAPELFKSEKEYIANAARITLRCISSIFILLIIALAVFFVLICTKAGDAVLWISGAVVAFFALLIVKVLLTFAHSVRSAHQKIYK